ncbi:hypothetical protein ACFQZS_07635 [Mucilaginibacter calamicampi]|uniref:Uncharacterized protein n=1 Tax=Mucilaginibacter calamicampi TaxID=1302352 RepID=A0ABW2YUA1_9SPHI
MPNTWGFSQSFWDCANVVADKLRRATIEKENTVNFIWIITGDWWAKLYIYQLSGELDGNDFKAKANWLAVARQG